MTVSKLTVKEYGITAFINSHFNEYIALLQKHFPEYYKEIAVLSYCKLAFKCPFKNVEFHYLQSFISEQFPDLSLSPKKLSQLLKIIGGSRSNIIDFFKEFGKNEDSIIFDGTDLVSNSKKMDITKFGKRVIWYYTIKCGDENIYVYLDDELKAQEIKDYLDRTERLPEKFSISEFHQRQHRFGTISLINNIDKSTEDVFVDYKSRAQIETMIDALKNIIDADKSYMQNEQSLEALMFINYIALHWYYRILMLLKENKLNTKYSPMDLIAFLNEVKKVKINDKWYIAEITQKSKDLLDDLFSV